MFIKEYVSSLDVFSFTACFLTSHSLFFDRRFAQLAKENDEALRSDDANASLKRVPPANLVSKTGNEWKALPNEVKAKYEER
jgi:hypothetical protein